MKEAIGVKVWARDANWRQSIEDYISRPTLTIEGLVGGYGGPGGKTILPTKMTAKLDMRLVPDMTPEEVMAKLPGPPRQARLPGHPDRQERRVQLHVVDVRRLEDD
jgi:acetylornithine deacetylase/succinyl-diaminopimelate desuccinylase-like protein